MDEPGNKDGKPSKIRDKLVRNYFFSLYFL